MIILHVEQRSNLRHSRFVLSYNFRWKPLCTSGARRRETSFEARKTRSFSSFVTFRRFLIKRDARERNEMHYFTKRLCSFSLDASQSAFTAPSGIRLQMECKLEEYTKETTEPCIQEILWFRISFQFCQIIQSKRSPNE